MSPRESTGRVGDATGAQDAGQATTTIPPGGTGVDRPAALPVEYDGAALSDAERVELHRARADARKHRRAAARTAERERQRRGGEAR